MATKPLTSEEIALTEKKMDMTLDDIIKMSKTNTGMPKKQRASNKGQRINNGNQNRSFKVQQYMDSRSTLRKGALAQKRTSFKGNNFRLAAEAAQRAAFSPFRNNMHMKWMRRPGDAHRRPGNASNGGITLKKQQQPKQKLQQPKQHQQELRGETTLGQRPKTLDSLFANLKEQRMRAFTHMSNGVHTGGGALSHNRIGGPARVRDSYNRIASVARSGGGAIDQPRQPWLRGRFGSYRN